ncbi:MAG: hypothetical protein Unbinned1007contig1000_9 [Prokaryotic dsDNA virus sp.]|nr:MAG: hypothetical protein Unbinned1007contig1000_9 [Prokaryotic dsDNA virus sp.]
MEIPEIAIRTIQVPQIHVPEIYTPIPLLPIVQDLQIDVAGCTYQHRDIKNTGNSQLLLDDPNGVFTTCSAVFPSFFPMDYRPDQLVITEDLPVSNDPPPMPEGTEPPINTPKEKEEIEIPECPSNSDQRVGDFRNEKRLERVTGHKRGDDGIECITIYENVAFKDQYIPEVSTIVSTAVIGLVAASTPLLLNAVKPLVKQIVKKVTKKKKDVK